VLLTLPAVASSVVTVLALFAGVAAIAVSSGPGLRALRWFGVAALGASVYAVCALESTLDLSADVRPIFGRLGGAMASVLVGAWFVYFPATQGRPLARWERTIARAIAVIAVAWLIPGVCRTSRVFTRTVDWLGVTYTTTRPTPLGQLTYVFLLLVTLVLAVRLFRSWREGKRGALADCIGVTVQMIAGVNDALAASGRIDMPYLLDVGQFVVVFAVGANLVSRFVADARALERSSAELQAAQKELVRRERLAALGELSAVVAHEVRNPVTVIFNAVSSLRKQAVSTEASTLLDIVDEEAQRLKHVVGELLEFARPPHLSVETVKTRPLVDGAVEAAIAGFGGGDLVEVDAETELPELAGDEQLLRQALINLITNALQAAGRKDRVHVRARADGKTIAFAVSDDGDGITPAVAERLFTPFFTTRASGTGLGLAIVKRIAEAHGGEIEWAPRAERGVTFTLRVPLRCATA